MAVHCTLFSICMALTQFCLVEWAVFPRSNWAVMLCDLNTNLNSQTLFYLIRFDDNPSRSQFKLTFSFRKKVLSRPILLFSFDIFISCVHEFSDPFALRCNSIISSNGLNRLSTESPLLAMLRCKPKTQRHAHTHSNMWMFCVCETEIHIIMMQRFNHIHITKFTS